jgi:spermidine synthase
LSFRNLKPSPMKRVTRGSLKPAAMCGRYFFETRGTEFDVIITDSSDPVGPANSLFQKPYFQLLKESLREGGTIYLKPSPMKRVTRGSLKPAAMCGRYFFETRGTASSSLKTEEGTESFVRHRAGTRR